MRKASRPSQPVHALTIRAQPHGILNKIITEVSLALPSLLGSVSVDGMGRQKFRGLWDTGASGTAITPAVVAALGLQPIDKKTVNTAAGPLMADVFLVDLLLPMGVVVPNIPVTALPLFEIDVLVGMDIMNLGDFSITNHRGLTLMSFRMPSQEHHDYVLEANASNAYLTKISNSNSSNQGNQSRKSR